MTNSNNSNSSSEKEEWYNLFTLKDAISVTDDEVRIFFEKLNGTGSTDEDVYPFTCKCGHMGMKFRGLADTAFNEDQCLFSCEACEKIIYMDGSLVHSILYEYNDDLE